ncbi:hypothetical protein DPMN_035156 [Dreissena polymorpha]|uniref:Uncharacterized protein n=1 Tax=Dreissena polymorpha TaxID=45954 RepID=A0A9D4M953_DREPO|nr:hypothetical protein DPMN_035156 [Dreissena polymorpha]
MQHKGAVMFAISDALFNGTWGIKVCTEELCAWTDTKGRKCASLLFSQIPLTKKEEGLEKDHSAIWENFA